MKYLKSYKIFESVGKIHFPTYTELHDFFVELEDDEITKFNYNNSARALSKFIDGGYLFFPQRWERSIQSQLYFDMSFHLHCEEDFLNYKPKELMGETWSEFFMDPVTYSDKKFLRRRTEWIHLDDVEEKRTNIKQLGKDAKTFEELFVEEIEKGNIKAYPFIYMTFDMFSPEHLDEVIERLKMVYEETDFRPLYGFWKEDYVDENNGDLVTLINSSLYLVNVSDEEYKSMIEIFNENNLDKQVTQNFI
jgi:hypothetical protein